MQKYNKIIKINSVLSFTILFCFILLINTNIADIPLYEDKFLNIYTLKLSIGLSNSNQKQTFNILVDTGSSQLTIPSIDCKSCESSNKFDYSKSKTFSTKYKPSSVKYFLGFSKGIEASDLVEIGNFSPIGMKFLLTNERDSNEDQSFDGIIGLAHNDMESYNLIGRLYERNLIKRRLFSIYFPKEGEGKLCLGRYPSEIETIINKRKDENFLNSCSIEAQESFWSCKSFGISVISSSTEKEELPMSTYFLFDTGNNNNKLSSRLFDLLASSLFKNLIEKKICFEQKSERTTYIFCHPELQNHSFPDIEIDFNRSFFLIKRNELFFYYSKENLYRFIFSRINNDRNINFIGINLMKPFVNIFDKDNHVYKFIRYDQIGNVSLNPSSPISSNEKIEMYDENGFFTKEFLNELVNKLEKTKKDTTFLKTIVTIYNNNAYLYIKQKDEYIKNLVLNMNIKFREFIDM